MDVHNPMIERGIRRDIYVQFHGTRSHISTEAVVPLSIRIVPWISLLWAGCLFMVVGITGIVVSIYLLALKKRKRLTRTMKR
jgi:cytochrome c biogenesis factor